jgi:hypothetical protein
VGAQGPQGLPGIIPAPAVPRIESVAITQLGTLSAGVAWTTVPECSGIIKYGTTAALGSSAVANNLATTDHFVVVSGLSTRKHYFYQVTSVCGGVTISSGIRSFNTK